MLADVAAAAVLATAALSPVLTDAAAAAVLTHAAHTPVLADAAAAAVLALGALRSDSDLCAFLSLGPLFSMGIYFR